MAYLALLYRYWWNTRIFTFAKKSYLHRAQWRYYFYLSRVRILVSLWLLAWLANYMRASCSGARRFFWNFTHKMALRCEDGTVTGDFLQIFTSILFRAWRTFRKSRKVMLKNFIYVGISSVSIKQTEHYVAKRSFPQRRKGGGNFVLIA